MITKVTFFVLVLVFVIPSIYSVFAQNDNVDAINEKGFLSKMGKLDNTLNPIITATLTGLSLTGASFLVNVIRVNNESKESIHINNAKKHFIKAFFMFIICTVILLIFDFLQILDERNTRQLIILDVVITYAFFAIGVVHLVTAARHLYFTYGK